MDLYVAGSFAYAGDRPSPYIALWHEPTLSIERVEPSVAGALQSDPNPFLESVRVRFSVPTPGPVSIVVHDATGREVATIFRGVAEAGESIVEWSPSPHLSSGLYFCRLRTETGDIVEKMVRF